MQANQWLYLTWANAIFCPDFQHQTISPNQSKFAFFSIIANNGGTIDLTTTRQTIDEAVIELTLRH